MSSSRTLRIDLIANDGSPLGVTPNKIEREGVGGAELSMICLMDELASRGHQVCVYNDPPESGVFGAGVKYENRTQFNRVGKRDALIIFRSPNALIDGAVGKKIWWSTDQYTIGDFKVFSHKVDNIVAISPFHKAHLVGHWGIEPKLITTLDLGVRASDYQSPVAKVPYRMIFCSVPDRGLHILHAVWPYVIREIPGATLTITSDYRLWGAGAGNHRHRLAWAGMNGVTFFGRVPRAQLVELQGQAQLMAYPCTYDELFCIAAAECAVAGAMPITSQFGALPTTNEFGIQVPGDPTQPVFVSEFAKWIVGTLHNQEALTQRLPIISAAAKIRFDWRTIADKWEQLVLTGKVKP